MSFLTVNNYFRKNLSDIESFSPEDFDTKMTLIIKQLRQDGILFIKNVYANSDAEYVAKKLGIIQINIDADNAGITEISNKKKGNNKKNCAAFTAFGLHLHTDRSPLENPPNVLINWMCEKSQKGGEALFADGYEIFNFINTYKSNAITDLIDPNIACFSDGIDTFIGPIFSTKNNALHVRFRYDHCAFFNLEAHQSIQILLQTIKKLTHTINFDIGCGYILSNDRWLHGRNSFEGNRTVRRIHLMGNF